MVTVAFGITAPLGSVTVPLKVPEVACAKLRVGVKSSNAHTIARIKVERLSLAVSAKYVRFPTSVNMKVLRMTISYYRDGNGISRACQKGRGGTRFALHVSTKPQTLQEGLCLKLRMEQRAGAYCFALQHGPFQRCGSNAK